MAKKTDESWEFLDFTLLSRVDPKQIGFIGRSEDRKSLVIRFGKKGSNKVAIIKPSKDGSVYGRTNVSVISQKDEVSQTIKV